MERYLRFHRPAAVEPRLKLHIEDVRVQYEKDLRDGGGYVTLPKALRRIYPNADRAWGWQWVFPAHRQYVGREAGCRSRHHLDESVLQRAVKDAATRAGVHKRVTCHTFRHSFATHLTRSHCSPSHGFFPLQHPDP